MNPARRLTSALAIASTLAGCATPLHPLSDHDLCLQRVFDASTQLGGPWQGPAKDEAARRGLDCSTPALEAEAIKLQTGGMRVVKPGWLPAQGASWAVMNCRSNAASLRGYDWIETYTLKDDTERTCLQARGLGR